MSRADSRVGQLKGYLKTIGGIKPAAFPLWGRQCELGRPGSVATLFVRPRASLPKLKAT